MNKYYPHSYYAKRKLEFLVNSDNLNNQIMLQDLFINNRLIDYLLDIEIQVKKVIKRERLKLFTIYGINQKLQRENILDYVSSIITINNELRILVNEMIIYA